jgi:hypothetical protein
MLYEELPPPPVLAPYVECFWVGRADAAFLAQRFTIATVTEPARGKRLGDG